jgi:DNA (cytosine-5)-methyltransferase 1
MKVYDKDSVSCTQIANGGGWGAKTGLYKVAPLKIATATKKGYDEVYPGDGIRLDHPGSVTGRGRTQSKGVGTLTCSSNWGAVDEKSRVRRLIPLESERLQGFPDNWTKYGVEGEEISDAQRYKCMGNAFTVNVIKYILNSFYDMEVEDE